MNRRLARDTSERLSRVRAILLLCFVHGHLYRNLMEKVDCGPDITRASRLNLTTVVWDTGFHKIDLKQQTDKNFLRCTSKTLSDVSLPQEYWLRGQTSRAKRSMTGLEVQRSKNPTSQEV